jgi:hypothetical protein
MELAVISGLGYLGYKLIKNNDENTISNNKIRLFPSETDKYTHHVYDTRIEKNIDDEYYSKAKIQRDKSNNPTLTNIIPPMFNNINSSNNDIIMGTVPNIELNNNESNYTNQFNLQTIDNINEPVSRNDIWNSSNKDNLINIEKELALSGGFTPFNNEHNMTYNVTNDNTHNNMQPFTSQRDFNSNKESNNFEYKMEVFSGSSKNWNPKTETLPFFEPEHFKQLPFGSELVINEARERIKRPLYKQNERKFEPIIVQPGLNLDYNQQSSIGFHDAYRALPKNVDELRTENKPKIEYNSVLATGPKKGEKRGITANVIKRRPEQLRYTKVDDFIPNKADINAHKNSPNYLIPDNARMHTKELAGPLLGTTQVGPDNKSGDVKISKRVTHIEDKLGPTTTNQYNLNTKSYNILLQERNTTNYNDLNNAKSFTQGHIALDYNDISKTTKKENILPFDNLGLKTTDQPTIHTNDIARHTIKEDIMTKNYNNQLKNINSSYSNLTDKAKITIKEILSTQSYEQIINSLQHNMYANFNDTAKSTLREILSLYNSNNNIKSNNGTYSSLQDNPNNTLKEYISILENNNNLTGHKQIYSNLQDNIKSTTKETLTNKQFNNNINNTQKQIYSNLQDNIKSTTKETLTNKQFNNNINNTQTLIYSNLQDNIKPTTKETLTNKQFNNHIDNTQKQMYANLQDIARITTRQTLTEEEFNTFLTNTMHSYSNLTDNAKNTIREILSTESLNNMISAANKECYTNLSDNARQTLKELLTLQTFSNYIKQNIGSYSNISDDLKTTIRNIISCIEYNNNIKTNQQSTYSNLSDLAKQTIKEFIDINEYNYNINRNNQNIAINYDDIAKTTHKQDLLNENYISNGYQSNIGDIQVSYDIPSTMKDMNKNIDYISSGVAVGINKNVNSRDAEMNMTQNISKEYISQGRYPTLSGPKNIPSKIQYESMNQNNKPNYSRINPVKLINTNTNRDMTKQNIKIKPYYNEQIYNELLEQLDNNSLVNNILTIKN